MLVLSREIGSSIHIKAREGTCLLTLIEANAQHARALVLVNYAPVAYPGEIVSETVMLLKDEVRKLPDDAQMTLVDVREDPHIRVRVGIDAPKESSVHRLEVYEAIRQERRKIDPDSGFDEGLGGARVPRPSSPKPPSLDVRLEEPEEEE
jgi:carbon storage regulator CsrA